MMRSRTLKNVSTRSMFGDIETLATAHKQFGSLSSDVNTVPKSQEL
jgi:hypothetical protein